MPSHLEPDVMLDLTLPRAWRTPLAGAVIRRQTVGASPADVFVVHHPDRPDQFLKTEPVHVFSELPAEVARLRWLRGQGMAVPVVVDALEEAGRHWLWMSALPGADLSSSPALGAAQVVALVAAALRQLHVLPVSACPFDHRLPVRLAAAQARAAAGQVDAEDFDDARQGLSAQQVLQQLQAQVPAQADLVVTHGDACLPNLMADHGRFSGFIDCGRLGVADRHQDLALAARSIGDHLGAAWVAPFFAHYGIEPDTARLDFYCLLDELF
ncbi:aminoglycoside 3'-phosphotransferase [Bacillus subtilis subsp. subtilis]|nr:aminoglycoside 3'-phosphotransferase [Bacillus subtilis subsp. subtilis]